MSLFVVLLVLFVASAVTLDLFVSSLSGNDTANNGSSVATPLRSLARVQALLAALQPPPADVSIALFANETFDACLVSLRAAASVRLSSTTPNASAIVSCATFVNASGTAVSGVFEMTATTAVLAEDVAFVGFAVFNASAVALAAQNVSLLGVSVRDSVVSASFSFVASAHAELASHSAVSVRATFASIRRSAFGNNSLSLTVDGGRGVTGGDTRFAAVPGGAALAIHANKSNIADCVFDGNALIGASSTPDLSRYHVFSGAAVFMGSAMTAGSVERSTFSRQSFVGSESTVGGVLSWLAPTAAVAIAAKAELSVTDCAFENTSLRAPGVFGGVVALFWTDDSPPGAAVFRFPLLTLRSVSIDGTSISDPLDSKNLFVTGGIIAAPFVSANQLSVTRSQLSTLVLNGMFYSAQLYLAQSEICDSFLLGFEVTMISIYSSSVCSALAMANTSIVRNTADTSASGHVTYNFVILARKLDSGALGVSAFEARCDKLLIQSSLSLESVTVRENSLLLNQTDRDAARAFMPMPLVDWIGNADLRYVVFQNNSCSGGLMLNSPSVTLNRVLVDNPLLSFGPQLDIAGVNFLFADSVEVNGMSRFAFPVAGAQLLMLNVTLLAPLSSSSTAVVLDLEGVNIQTVSMRRVRLRGTVLVQAPVRLFSANDCEFSNATVRLTYSPLANLAALYQFVACTFRDSTVTTKTLDDIDECQVATVFQSCAFHSSPQRSSLSSMVACQVACSKIFVQNCTVFADDSEEWVRPVVFLCDSFFFLTTFRPVSDILVCHQRPDWWDAHHGLHWRHAGPTSGSGGHFRVRSHVGLKPACCQRIRQRQCNHRSFRTDRFVCHPVRPDRGRGERRFDSRFVGCALVS
jgi:hypothetical protein